MYANEYGMTCTRYATMDEINPETVGRSGQLDIGPHSTDRC